MNKTLKFFYGENYLKPVYSSTEYEIGEQSRMSVTDSKKNASVNAFVISQEEMSQEQADLFFYLWSKRDPKASFENSVKTGIHLSVEVLKYNEAGKLLKACKERDEQLRQARLDASLNRYLRSMFKNL